MSAENGAVGRLEAAEGDCTVRDRASSMAGGGGGGGCPCKCAAICFRPGSGPHFTIPSAIVRSKQLFLLWGKVRGEEGGRGRGHFVG